MVDFFVVVGLLATTIIFACCFNTLMVKNRKTKTLKTAEEEIDKCCEKYSQKLFELINIKTTNKEDEHAYHKFGDKLKELFPNLHKYFVKEKIEENIIFTYKTQKTQSQSVLFVTHMDTFDIEDTAFITDKEVFGRGTFDSKALLFSVFQAVEEQFESQFQINVDLTIVVTIDDETTKEGNEKIVDKFLRKGRFFSLVIEQGVGIIDPKYFGLKSNYALIGIGVTGEAKVQYKTQKTQYGFKNMHRFIKEIENNKIFKPQIDQNAHKILYSLAKDMPFTQRLLYRNLFLFKLLVKRDIECNRTEIANLLKTHVSISEIKEDDTDFYIDVLFHLSTHDTSAEVINHIDKYVRKYNMDFKVISIKEPSKVTTTKMKGYKIVNKVIKKTFKDLYTAPYIITKISEQRFFTRVSDCVIRFSPLYYPHETLINSYQGEEHIMKSSLKYGVEFFKNILNNYEEEK